jgi:glycosyltransferase involved in cell wall biosynthesis
VSAFSNSPVVPLSNGPVVSSRLPRLAILASHPIQYFSPWFRHLNQYFDLEVLYAHRQDEDGQAKAGFGVKFAWDIPLLEGYRHRWLRNVARQPGLQTFGGCDTPEIYKLVEQQRYDAMLVLGWNRKSFVQGIRACWRNRIPILCRGDSQLRSPRSTMLKLIKYLPYRCFLPRIDAHLYVGQRNKEYLKHYGVREKQLFFSPHFVDNQFFTEGAKQARSSGRVQALRDEFKIPTNAFVALFVGKFIPKKRPADFVHATLKVSEAHPQFHGLLVGDGPLRPELENSARSHKDRVHFAGFRNQSEMPAFYAAADTLVMVSEETWGLAINEAMACGVPAIVSEVAGCVPDLIDEAQTGFTFPLGDVEALSRCLTIMCNELSTNKCMIDNSLKRKCETHSMVCATAGLDAAVQALASRTTNSNG